jgi:hypothetical protein
MNNELSSESTPQYVAKRLEHAKDRRRKLESKGIYSNTSQNLDADSPDVKITRRYYTPHYNVGIAARLTTSPRSADETLDIIASISHHESLGTQNPANYVDNGFDSSSYLEAKQSALRQRILDTHPVHLEQIDLQSKLRRDSLRSYQKGIDILASTDRDLQWYGYTPRLENSGMTTRIAYTKQFNPEAADEAIDRIQKLDIMQR